jgi:RepB DNA-primase from phage plasmid/CHC2 zinc finger
VTPHLELSSYLRFIASGARPGQHLDVRLAPPDQPMRKRLIPVGEVKYMAKLIAAHASSCDVYVGVAPRDDPRHGGRAAISASRLLHLESDQPDSLTVLESFAVSPSLVVSSGTPGHFHAYWQLHAPALPEQVEATNRSLARALGGQLGCADLARVLRPPETLNHKHHPPRPVCLLAYRPQLSYSVEELIAALPPSTAEPHLPPRPSAKNVRCAGRALEQELLGISAADYVRLLVERTPNRHGKILCPFHRERNASLHLYPDGSFYCFGASCQRGGTIIDFAGHLWGITPRGAGFHEILDRLAEALAGHTQQ